MWGDMLFYSYKKWQNLEKMYEISNWMSYLRALYDSLEISMWKICIGIEFWIHVKEFLGSNLYFYCFEYLLQVL